MAELNNIVCIDDEPDIRGLVKMILETVGNFTVKDYCNGPTALEALKNQTPDMLLIDGMMPEMSGMDVLKEINKMEHLKNTPVAFMTARIQPKEKEEYISLGASGIIEKPFEPMELPDLVRSIWEKAQSK